jgi:hypothetical protein
MFCGNSYKISGLRYNALCMLVHKHIIVSFLQNIWEKKLILMQKKTPKNFVYGTFCYRHIMDGVTVLEVKI